MTVQHNASLFRCDTKSIDGVLSSIFYKNPADYMFRHRLGPYAFVQAYAPPLKYQAVLHDEGSVTPTMGFEAYGLALFGYAGLLVQVVASGVALAALGLFIERALRSGNPLRALFPAFLLNASLKLFAQGTLFNVCSVPMFKSYAAFLLFRTRRRDPRALGPAATRRRGACHPTRRASRLTAIFPAIPTIEASHFPFDLVMVRNRNERVGRECPEHP